LDPVAPPDEFRGNQLRQPCRGLPLLAAAGAGAGELRWAGRADRLLHRDLVERRRWLSERRYLHALNYCMLLPGPEAPQLATYLG
jgi:hypothetical protein